MRKPDDANYCFYATLLDCFQNYLDAEESYDKYYGSSEDPKVTIDEWSDKLYNELIDRINRVPFESPAAERGTQFNNLIDIMIGVSPGVHVVEFDEEKGKAVIGDTAFVNDEDGNEHEVLQKCQEFPLQLAREMAQYYEGSVPQYFCNGVIDTKYGKVKLYGYIDYISEFKIHDLKTTRFYSNGNYRKHWQHKVYPYCLKCEGIDIKDFEYNVTDFKKVWTEFYSFVDGRDDLEIRNMCERLIEFLESNKEKITDKKIFNIEE